MTTNLGHLKQVSWKFQNKEEKKAAREAIMDITIEEKQTIKE